MDQAALIPVQLRLTKTETSVLPATIHALAVQVQRNLIVQRVTLLYSKHLDQPIV